MSEMIGTLQAAFIGGLIVLALIVLGYGFSSDDDGDEE